MSVLAWHNNYHYCFAKSLRFPERRLQLSSLCYVIPSAISGRISTSSRQSYSEQISARAREITTERVRELTPHSPPSLPSYQSHSPPPLLSCWLPVMWPHELRTTVPTCPPSASRRPRCFLSTKTAETRVLNPLEKHIDDGQVLKTGTSHQTITGTGLNVKLVCWFRSDTW